MDRLDIINKALLKIGQTPVKDLSDQDNKLACALAIYDSVRNTEQASYRWTFCTKRFSLKPLAIHNDETGEYTIVKPAFGYAYQYILPKGFLRLIEIYGHRQMDYTIEDGKLLTNTDGPLNIIALCEEDVDRKLPPAFVEVFACKLAIELTRRIQQDSSLKAELRQEYYYALSVAKKTDAIQRATDRIPDGDWVDVRFGGM